MKILLIASLIIISQLCYSQEQEKESKKDSLKYAMQEFVVVGTRTAERIIDVPYSVFRVDKKELSYGKKISAKDVLADVPGLFVQSRYGNHDLRVSIRGFGTRSNSGVRGVRILQDGIPESEPDGETVIDAIDFTSLGGVEVVKGNLSSLYANAPGGVVNFISDLYFLKNYVSSTNQIGAFGFRQNGFKVGLSNPDNRLFLSYNYRNIDGYRQHSNENQHLLNVIYESYLGKLTTFTILANYVDGLIKLPGSLTRAEFEADPLQANPLAITQDFKRVSQKGRLAFKYKTSFDEESRQDLEIIGYGGLKELTKTDNDLYTVSTRYSLGGLAKYSTKFEIAEHPNIFTIGTDYAFQAGPVSEFTNNYGEPYLIQSQYDASLSNLGFYFLDHFTALPEQLELFVSSRYDYDIFQRKVHYGLIDTSRSFAKFTPKAGANFKLSPMIALYSSYGISYDFPALSELTNNPFTSNSSYSINPDLTAQTSYNFELGIKGNIVNPGEGIPKKMFFEATYFHYYIHDEIVPFIINQKTYFRNAGVTNRQGIEMGINSEPFEHIEFVMNYTYTDFIYDKYITTIYSPGGSIIKDYTGKVVPSVPKHILNLILTYEWEISKDISGILQWDCDYIDNMYTDDDNVETSAGYFYGNALAGINVGLPNFNLIAYVGSTNIFDRRFSGFVNINDFHGRYFETGEPRNVYAGLRITFAK